MNSTNFISAGSGQPIIFLHGMGSTCVSWQPQLDEFGQDYHAISLDLPGYGESTSLPENTFSALAGWLHNAIQQNGWTEPILVGNSYGGMIAQEYLYRYPDVAKVAVLYGTSPAFGRKDGEWQQQFIQARLGPLDAGKTMADLAPTIVAGLVGSGASPEGVEAAEQDMMAVSEETFRTVVHTLITFDRRDNLPNITIPCLVLVGEEDRNAPPKVMQKMSTYIPSATFVQMPLLGHIAHIENPAVFNRVLRDFLETV